MNATGDRKNLGILGETLASLRELAGNDKHPVTVERYVLGLFFTGVKLSNGFGGLCYTPIKTAPEAVCCPSSAKATVNPGSVRDRNAIEVAEKSLAGTPLQRAVGIAIINALSSAYWKQACTDETKAGFCIERPGDPIDDLRLSDNAYVVVVGAIVPYLRFLKTRGRPFCVLEQDPTTLKPDELPFYAPADQAEVQVPRADVLVATGTTLLNDTLEGLLSLARPDTHVIVVGPTASMLPGALFRRGVNELAGIRVTDPDALLNVLAEGGSGYHFFGQTAEKIRMIRPHSLVTN